MISFTKKEKELLIKNKINYSVFTKEISDEIYLKEYDKVVTGYLTSFTKVVEYGVDTEMWSTILDKIYYENKNEKMVCAKVEKQKLVLSSEARNYLIEIGANIKKIVKAMINNLRNLRI